MRELILKIITDQAEQAKQLHDFAAQFRNSNPSKSCLLDIAACALNGCVTTLRGVYFLLDEA